MSISHGSLLWRPITAALFAVSLAALPTTSFARPESQLVSDVVINGTGTDVSSGATSSLIGSITLTGLAYNTTSQTLTFEGSLSGTVAGDGITTQIADQIFVSTGTLESLGGKKCSIVNLDLGPINLDLLGLNLDVSPVELDVSGVKGKGKLLGNLLCGLTDLLNPPDPDMINFQVTRINSIIGTVLDNLEVQGTIGTTGTLTGFMSVNGFNVDSAGNLVVIGTLNGVAAGDGFTTNVVNQVISTTASLVGSNVSGKGKKCELITIDLAPVHLDILGAQVDLSAVSADLTAVTGSGKLLGNLLCKLSKALDGGIVKPNTISKLQKTALKINPLLQ